MKREAQHPSICRLVEIRIIDGFVTELIGAGVAAGSLKTICLKELNNGQCFGPLIVGSKKLKALKLFSCSGDWDKLLEVIADKVMILVSIANRRKLLRKLHIDGWKTNRIGDKGLIAIAKRCPNLQELVLIGVNPTTLSLGLLGANCQNLQRLALCASETIGDAEICCITSKFMALKTFCIKGCPVSDHGMEALTVGCPNLIKVKVKKCKGVTCEGAGWLRASRGSLAVNLDTAANEPLDRYPSDVVVVENEGLISHSAAEADIASSSNGRSSLSKPRYFGGRFGSGLSFDLENIEVSLQFVRIWQLVRICAGSGD
ncbi:hypothetical protein GIB67_015756 [Kingdonia uniflora]|uniref:F-box protein n=1 Tax=Kingdonia uniflora TaxID=39325 RepID=A0A7J7NV21_9MAGN|nr:hypothetical protein GIB67_015756 [Kingdonia uniflora]